MKRLFVAAVAATLAVSTAFAAGLKSGPQSGEKVPGPFHPLNVTGEDAGKKACLFCKNGDNPVAVVFARNADDPALGKLLKALDEATVKNEKAEMGSYAVFLTDDDKLEGKLKAMNSTAGLKKLVLSIDNPTGPPKYSVSKDADVTVLLYTNRTVKANHSFEKGKLDDKAIQQVVADVTKILP